VSVAGDRERRFPDPTYAAEVLEPAFESARDLLFQPLLVCTMAHVVALQEAGLLDRAVAGRLGRRVKAVLAEGPGALRYDPAVEDLYFAVESRLDGAGESGSGGWLGLARSRNDLDSAMARMRLRDELLEVAELLLQVAGRILKRAGDHLDTLLAGVTHTQEAQPTTLAHYLMGVVGPLLRDADRLRQSYERTNQSPLGACAFTTTRVPIDRPRLAALLGFAGVVENGYDAVGAADYMLEAVSTLRALCLGLGRWIGDLLVWCRTDVHLATVGDEFVQISSIMPQKRNPVVLEHVRARAGWVSGDATTVESMVRAAAFGDTVDVEDPIYVPLFRCCGTTKSVLSLAGAVLETLRFDEQLMSQRAQSGFGVATDVAERLAIEFELPYRSAHQAVSQLVGRLREKGRGARDLSPAEVEDAVWQVSGHRIEVSQEWVEGSTSARGFVDARAGLGGPAPVAVVAAVGRAKARLHEHREWVRGRRSALATAQRQLADLLDGLGA
jgi:argininosuccinate lyase